MLNEPDINARISEYGNTLALPPASFVEKIDNYEYKDGSGLALDTPLWTKEEGMSDLTLSLVLIYSKKGTSKKGTDLFSLEKINLSPFSPYTSWTRSPDIARQFAKEDGLILRVKIGAPKEGDKWSWQYSKDRWGGGSKKFS
ncbi:DUF7668 domain-containing protein [Pseudomonas mandelii]|uniref:DUF7668 domain-containing protein n=1 Tax=Pseudomonas mandelii TaxID=75612 RepID=UPI003F5D6F4C